MMEAIRRMGTALQRKQAASRVRQRGFTLIELMVVIAIIGVLAAVVTTNLLSSAEEGNVTAAKAQIKQFETSLMNYKLKKGSFPSTSEGLQALVSGTGDQRFLNSKEVPKDPWNNDYQYKAGSADGFPYEIISYGADGQPGGDGYNADIKSTEL